MCFIPASRSELPGDGGVDSKNEAVVDTQALAAAVAYVQEALIYRMRECEPVIGDGDPPSAEQTSCPGSVASSYRFPLRAPRC